MWLFEALIGLAAKKMAPAQEDERPYIFTGKVNQNIANPQTFSAENTKEVFAAIGEEWEAEMALKDAEWRNQWTPTPTAIVTNETPPIAGDEVEYTAAPIATSPPPITTTTPANVNITETPIYYNFPITVVAGFMDDPHAALRRMIVWQTFDKTRRMKHERGRDRLFYALAEMDYEVADKQAWYNECGEIYHLYKGPRCGISRKMWWEVVESVDYWREDEKVLFLSFLAAKSIQGNKPYTLTCNRQMCARMNGRATTYASDEEMREQSHLAILAAFSTPKKWRKRREWMAQQYRVASYSRDGMRGYYISTKMPLERLAAAVERKRAKNAKSYTERMREAGDIARATSEKNKPKRVLGPGEMIDDAGNRYYINQWSGTKIIVPDDAPPRPSKNHIWARSEGCWITN